jgi:hypothetical protein
MVARVAYQKGGGNAMAGLIRNRWLRLALYGGALVALAVIIYHVQPPAPLCAVNVGHDVERRFPHRLSGDGRRLATLKNAGQSPLQIWDTRTGVEIGRFFEEQNISAFAFSPDDRLFAADIQETPKGPHVLSVVDLLHAELLEIPLERRVERLTFSGDGQLLAAMSGRLQGDATTKMLTVYEVATGRRLYQQKSVGFVGTGEAPFFRADLAIHFAPSKTTQKHVAVIDPWTGELAGTLANVGDSVEVTRDGKYLIGSHAILSGAANRGHDHANPADQPDRQWTVWNLRTLRVESRFAFDDLSIQIGLNGDDARFFARSQNVEDTWSLELHELPSGRRVGESAFAQASRGRFSEDDRFLAATVLQPTPALVMFETPDMNVLWSHDRAAGPLFWGVDMLPLCFGPDAELLFVRQANPRRLLALDRASGEVRTAIDVPAVRRGIRGIKEPLVTPAADGSVLVFEADGKMLPERTPFWAWLLKPIPWITLPETKNDIAVVLDGHTGAERFRVQGRDTTAAKLSRDGATLVTMEKRVFYCWDVNGGKPLRWALGVPALLAGLGLAVSWRARKLRAS